MLFPVIQTPELFCQITRPKIFHLVVDNFCANIFGIYNSDHLVNTFKNHNVTIDWNGESFCGFKLKWYYDTKTVDLSMPNYVNKALARLHHNPPINPQYSFIPIILPFMARNVNFSSQPQPIKK